jgi:hypothetical protein
MIYLTAVLTLKGLTREGSVNELIHGRKDKGQTHIPSVSQTDIQVVQQLGEQWCLQKALSSVLLR